MKKIRIGGGAGFSGDRIPPAVELVESGDIDYIVFECLAERTIMLAQQRRRLDPSKGYDPLVRETHACHTRIVREEKNKDYHEYGSSEPTSGGRISGSSDARNGD